MDQYSVQHELRKRIFERFRKEGIEIPFPIRTIYLKGGDRCRGADHDALQAAGSPDSQPEAQRLPRPEEE